MNSNNLAWLIRRHAIEMTHRSGGSHIGSIMSVADIIAVLYADILKYNINNPDWEGRDRFILSKGHSGAALYIALAECGFFDVSDLDTYYLNGSVFSGHVSHHVKGVDVSTGSLGHGLSIGAGMALSFKKDNKDNQVYVVLGDGECNEGSVWEAIMFANHYRLNNLTAIVDYNHMQSLDFTDNTIEVLDIAKKWEDFGWNVVQIDGNNHDEIRTALKTKHESKPTVVIANTIKGYGISFMQNDILWHYRFPHDGWEYDTAVTDLHKIKPNGVKDPYTPNGIENPVMPTESDDIGNDHTTTHTWSATNIAIPRRVEAKPGSNEKVHRIEK